MSSKSSRRSELRSSSYSVNTLPVVSPRLCSCDVHDGTFVDRSIQDIEKFIFEELKKLDHGFHNSKKDRFTVFRRGFEMLIEDSVSFKTLLSDINAEYLSIIDAVENGHHQRRYITRDLKRAIAEKGTLINYERRVADLQAKAGILRDRNEQLKALLEQMEKEKEESYKSETESKTSQHHVLTHSRLFLPGLEMEEQTDLQTLASTLARLQVDVKETRENLDTKFRIKEQKALLKNEFEKKARIQHHVTKYNTELRDRLGKLNVAVETVKSTLAKQAKDQNIFDVVIKAVNAYKKIDVSKRRDPLQQLLTSDEDDPLKKKESERLISYIEYFNDLFDFGQYDAAAIHAASSPKGILRTYQAMLKFKEIDVYDGPKSPLFLFCEALMSTSISKGDSSYLVLSAQMSVECITCAFVESGMSLALHWLNQPCITMSVALADLLSSFCKCSGDCCCHCQALAEGIYKQFNVHSKAAIALSRQGKHKAVIEYGQTHGAFTIADYQDILKCNPTVEFATMLLQASLKTPNTRQVTGLSFCSITRILLQHVPTDSSKLVAFLNHVETSGIRCAKGVRYSIQNLIFGETASDEMDDNKWNRVVDLCYKSDHELLAVEILSTLLVRQALNHAAISSSMDYIS